MDSAEKCVELLITEDELVAEEIALELRAENRERQAVEERIFRKQKKR